MVALIEAHEVVKNYGKFRALDYFEMSIPKNTIHALVGPNSSGKSTVIKILSTEVRPDSGEVTIMGIPITNTREIRSMVSVVPDLSRVPDNQTPRRLLEGAGKSCRLGREEIKYRVDVLADTLDMAGDMDRRVGELSRGIKRRVSLGMALIGDASILLMDGSLAELDPTFCVKFMDALHETGDKTILLTANNMNLVDRVCDGVTIIRNGTTLMNETMTTIREKIGRPAITFKVSPLNIQKLEAVLNQQLYVNNIYCGHDSILVEVDDVINMPSVIRDAATFTEIYEARQTIASLEEFYQAFMES